MRKLVEFEVSLKHGECFIWAALEPYTKSDVRRNMDRYGHAIVSIEPWKEAKPR